MAAQHLSTASLATKSFTCTIEYDLDKKCLSVKDENGQLFNGKGKSDWFAMKSVTKMAAQDLLLAVDDLLHQSVAETLEESKEEDKFVVDNLQRDLLEMREEIKKYLLNV